MRHASVRFISVLQSRRAEKHAVATHEMFLPQHPELLKHRPRARSYLSAFARIPAAATSSGKDWNFIGSRREVHFEVLNSVIPSARTRTEYKMRLLYSLSHLHHWSRALCLPPGQAGMKQVSNSAMPFGQQAIARYNIFYSALTGADRQQRHAPMTRRLSQTGAVRTFARSSRSAASVGSSIPSFRPNRMASSRMRAAISQIFRSAPGPNLFRKERAAA